MRAVSSLLYHFALALWVGGGVLYTFVLTPAIFAAYPRNNAGEIVGTMMPHYFRFLMAAVVAAAVVLVVFLRAWPAPRRALCLALVIVALAAQTYVQWRLYPEILAVKSRVESFESNPDSPERRRFRSLHGVSMLLNLLVLMDGALLFALVPACGAKVPGDRTSGGR